MSMRSSLVVASAALLCALVGCQAPAPTAPPPASAPAVPPPAAAAQPASPGGPWRLAVLPDTQYYAARYPQHLTKMVDWLLANAQSQSIRYIIGVGDITDNNSDKQWQVAQAQIGRLVGKVPLALNTGNHDYGGGDGPPGRQTRLNRYFKPADFAAMPTAGELMTPGQLENSYHLFSAGGHDWLILCLEFGPRDEVVEWANSVLDRYPQRAAILSTHAYLTNDGPRLDQFDPKHGHNPHSYPQAKLAGGVNDGEELWTKLVKPHPNVVLVLTGHISGAANQTSTNEAGFEVHEMLSDYQSEKEGGQGYFRLLTFTADGKTLQVRTFSPVLDHTREAKLNRFDLDLSKTFLGRAAAETAAAVGQPATANSAP